MNDECTYDFLIPEIDALAKKLDGKSLAEVSECLSAVVSVVIFNGNTESDFVLASRFIRDFSGLVEFLLEKERRNKV